MDNDMFDGDTPYDMLVNMGTLLENVVRAHNELADDHIALVDQLKRLRHEIDILQMQLDNLKGMNIK
jgi:hypothetical protein